MSTRVVLASSDPVFAALGQRALQGTSLELLAAVSPAELLETTRRCAPDLVVLDSDGEEPGELKLLATKVMLVSEARLVLVSAYLAPGSPGLSGLLQSIAATFVQKPQGPSSLSLAGEDGQAFVVALQTAYAAHAGEDLAGRPLGRTIPVAAVEARPRSSTIPPPSEEIDAGWEELPVTPPRADHD